MQGALLKCVEVHHANYCILTGEGTFCYVMMAVMGLITALAAITAATK